MTPSERPTQGRELDAMIAERVFGFTVTRDWPVGWMHDDSGPTAWRPIEREPDWSDERWERSLARNESYKEAGSLYGDRGPVYADPAHGGWLTVVPCYSTEIAAAWEVVAAMRDRHNCLLKLEQYLMDSDEREDWEATFNHRVTDEEWSNASVLLSAQPAPLAICLAALKAAEASSGNPAVVVPRQEKDQ